MDTKHILPYFFDKRILTLDKKTRPVNLIDELLN